MHDMDCPDECMRTVMRCASDCVVPSHVAEVGCVSLMEYCIRDVRFAVIPYASHRLGLQQSSAAPLQYMAISTGPFHSNSHCIVNHQRLTSRMPYGTL